MWRALCVWLLMAGGADALTCETLTFNDRSYTACTVDAGTEDLRLFLSADDGAPLGSFSAVAAEVAPLRLAFAMNAGMFHIDRAPVGLFIKDGEVVRDVVTSAGPGNFGLLPNGIFCIGEGFARVIETLTYRDTQPACRDATQSGPMLVIDGALHPRFLRDSASRNVRNGVGTSADGSTAVFVISNEPVTFHEFGTLFRDRFGTPQALYFDGNVSRLHAPAIGRDDFGVPLGPIVGVVE